jgi:hypothetical protein
VDPPLGCLSASTCGEFLSPRLMLQLPEIWNSLERFLLSSYQPNLKPSSKFQYRCRGGGRKVAYYVWFIERSHGGYGHLNEIKIVPGVKHAPLRRSTSSRQTPGYTPICHYPCIIQGAFTHPMRTLESSRRLRTWCWLHGVLHLVGTKAKKRALYVLVASLAQSPLLTVQMVRQFQLFHIIQ